MERLIKAKLFGAGLVDIDTEVLVLRYNECLEELGIHPTTLQSFRIDGMGWSPEIAQEKNNLFYLSAGIPNQMGIIVTPKQRNRPIYFPFHSYDKTLFEEYFKRFYREIIDITSWRGVALDIDQELTSLGSPLDLRLVDSIVVKSTTGKLEEIASAQKACVANLLEDEKAWLSQKLRAELVRLAKPYGDLRNRYTAIPEMNFGKIQSFYTRAFAGVFVICTQENNKILLLEDKAIAESLSQEAQVFHIHDPKALRALSEIGLIEIRPAWYQSYPQVLSYLKESLTAEILCYSDPQINYAELNSMQKKQLLTALPTSKRDVLHELERFIKQLQSNTSAKLKRLSSELQLLLMRPNRELPLNEQQVLRQYLHRLIQIDIIQMYADDKNFFFEQYKKWPESKRAWAVEKITDDYLLENAEAA